MDVRKRGVCVCVCVCVFQETKRRPGKAFPAPLTCIYMDGGGTTVARGRQQAENQRRVVTSKRALQFRQTKARQQQRNKTCAGCSIARVRARCEGCTRKGQGWRAGPRRTHHHHTALFRSLGSSRGGNVGPPSTGITHTSRRALSPTRHTPIVPSWVAPVSRRGRGCSHVTSLCVK